VTRSTAERIADTLTALERQSECWVASGRPDGSAHLIPLSFAWDGERIVLATFSDSVTVQSARRTGSLRFSLASTSDVVLIDARVDVADVQSIPGHSYQAFLRQAGFDPRRSGNDYSFLILEPRRVLAWRSEAELSGREIMREGHWRSHG
jgi:hypothetical protein